MIGAILKARISPTVFAIYRCAAGYVQAVGWQFIIVVLTFS
jgi:hypothetical protein